MSEMKPCPFCGQGSGMLIDYVGLGTWAMSCTCGASIKRNLRPENARKTIRDVWNNRPSETAAWEQVGTEFSDLLEKEAELEKLVQQNKRLAECLRWYVDNDETYEGDEWEEVNSDFLEGKRRAEDLLQELEKRGFNEVQEL